MKALTATILALVFNISAANAGGIKVLKTANIVQQTLEVEVASKCRSGFMMVSGALYTCTVDGLGLPPGGEILDSDSAGVKLSLDEKIWLEAQVIGAKGGLTIAFFAKTMKTFPNGAAFPSTANLDEQEREAARSIIKRALSSSLVLRVLYQGPQIN